MGMKHALSLLLPLAFTLGLPLVADAQAKSPGIVSTEFLSGWQNSDGMRMTAMKLVLEDGWKTYWRAPGDAGLPPRFDWTGSRNVASVVVHWPRPQLFETFGMRTVGYSGQMILPIEIKPINPDLPVWINGEVSFGVCRDICVPVFFDIDQILDTLGAPDTSIAAALLARPDPRPGVARCSIEPVLDGIRITAEITMPQLGTDEVALFELARQLVWVSESKNRREGATLISSAEIVPYDSRPIAIDRSEVVITVVSGKQAVEIIGCPG
jgi:DsbC/DsbD-like thiol-disulfide interchange protein